MKAFRPGQRAIWAALAAEVVALTLLTSSFGGEQSFTSSFLNWANISQVIRALSFIAIMAVGQSAVIIAGGIDLAAGSVLGLSGVACALMVNHGYGILFSIVASLVVGTACGTASGALVTKARVPPFIATLAMMSIARGLAFAVSGGETVRNLPAQFLELGQGAMLGIPIPIVVMLVFAALAGLTLALTAWGRYAYAVGGNEEAARYSGLDVGLIKIFVYSLSGFSAALAGVLFASRFGVGQSTAGLGYELDVIAAAVIGGVSLSGGRGTVLGAVLGSVLMGILRNGLVLLNVSAYWQQVAIGCVILLAVLIDRRRVR